MKFPGRKGQSALEYIQTYSWGILVVLIVGIVLWQLGVFGPHSGANTSSGFASMKILNPAIIYVEGTEDNPFGGTEDNIFNFTFVNAVGIRARSVYVLKNVSGDCSAILLDYIEFTTSESNCNLLEEPTYGIWIPPETCWVNQPVSLEAGDTAKPVFTRCNSLDAGEIFVVYLTFQYSERVGPGEPTTHQDGGVIMGTVEDATEL